MFNTYAYGGIEGHSTLSLETLTYKGQSNKGINYLVPIYVHYVVVHKNCLEFFRGKGINYKVPSCV